MSVKLKLLNRVSEGVVRLSFNNHVSLWDRKKLRKDNECCATGAKLAAGTLAYAPIGNHMYRYRRIAADYVDNVMTVESTELPKPTNYGKGRTPY